MKLTLEKMEKESNIDQINFDTIEEIINFLRDGLYNTIEDDWGNQISIDEFIIRIDEFMNLDIYELDFGTYNDDLLNESFDYDDY